MTRIELTSGGPIEGTFTLDLSPGPGAYEVRGRRGSGKTTLISSLDWLAGHKVDVTLHDGALSGKIEGFGAVAPIGGRKRRKGQFELDTLDAEKFSLSDIVDPPGQKPEVRDAHVIKAFASLSEMKADPKLYYELAGGQAEFDALGISKTDDPVLLATRVKKAWDTLASNRTKTAEAEAGHAAPLEVVPDGLDIEQSSDLTLLGAQRDEARDRHKSLADERQAGMQTELEAREAKERLDRLKAEYDGGTVEEEERTYSAAATVAADAVQDVKSLEKQLEEARRKRDSLQAEQRLILNRVETAKQHQGAVAALEEAAKRFKIRRCSACRQTRCKLSRH